jgi:hypothetical protein
VIVGVAPNRIIGDIAARIIGVGAHAGTARGREPVIGVVVQRQRKTRPRTATDIVQRIKCNDGAFRSLLMRHTLLAK